jgi:16S rRNA (uracil1498-N3)-methyltransferase
MDFLVEKCTELGVQRFIPFTAGRSQGRVDLERLKHRQQRRQAIVKTASKQCGRLHFMMVERDTGLDELIGLDLGPACRKIMLYEKGGGSTLAESIGRDHRSSVCLMIGPEGGFSDEEAAAAKHGGWQLVSLGGQILRAETAALAAVSVTSHLLGRM